MAVSKTQSLSLLTSNEFVKDVQCPPNNVLLFTYENENLGSFGPDAIAAADNSRQLLTCLAYDIPSVSVMDARKEYGNNVQTNPLWIGARSESCIRYDFLYLKKDFYRYPPTLNSECEVDGLEHHWFVFRTGNDELIKEQVRAWDDWIKNSAFKNIISYEDHDDGVLGVSAPVKMYDPIVALYMMFIDRRPKRRILRAVVSGGTREEALAEIDKVMGKR